MAVQDLTQGSVKRHFFRFLGAAFGSAMITYIYGLVDSAVVGSTRGRAERRRFQS